MNDVAVSPAWPIHLGCPVWGCSHWAGEVYPPRTPRKDWLAWYSRTFNTVEGNSTFYALPSRDALARWASETASGFQFCLKFPREISHDLQLVGAEHATATFLRTIEPLRESNRLGPTFLQLGPGFGPDRFDDLSRFLNQLPTDFAWAVELRHLGWFAQDEHEAKLNELLTTLSIDKVLFDSRALFQSPPDDEAEQASQRRKPKTPVRQTVTGRHPMLRIVGRNKIEMSDSFFDQWAPIVAGWVRQGLRPFVFAHTPDEKNAPAMARRFALRLQTELPTEYLTVPKPPKPTQQLSLLDDGPL